MTRCDWLSTFAMVVTMTLRTIERGAMSIEQKFDAVFELVIERLTGGAMMAAAAKGRPVRLQ
jgi:hypothetical protein